MIRILLFAVLIIPLSINAETYSFTVDPIEFPNSQETITGLEINTDIRVGVDAIITHSHSQSLNASGYCDEDMTCLIWPNTSVNGKLLYSIKITVDAELNGTLILFNGDSHKVGTTRIARRKITRLARPTEVEEILLNGRYIRNGQVVQ